MLYVGCHNHWYICSWSNYSPCGLLLRYQNKFEYSSELSSWKYSYFNPTQKIIIYLMKMVEYTGWFYPNEINLANSNSPCIYNIHMYIYINDLKHCNLIINQPLWWFNQSNIVAQEADAHSGRGNICKRYRKFARDNPTHIHTLNCPKKIDYRSPISQRGLNSLFPCKRKISQVHGRSLHIPRTNNFTKLNIYIQTMYSIGSTVYVDKIDSPLEIESKSGK